MHPYLHDTDFAARSLFRLVTDEENALSAMSKTLNDKERELRVRQWDFQTSDLNDDFSDAYVMAAFARAGNVAKEVENLISDVAAIQTSVGTRQHSVQALAGAILQIAKQGISLVHGGLASAPSGRSLGSLNVRDVIWEARNQSMHYEEGNYRKRMLDTFATLESEQGPQFSLASFRTQNRAKQVLDLLGWSTYDAYLQDMQSLLPSAT